MALIFLLLVMLSVFFALGLLLIFTHIAKMIGIAVFCILIVALVAVGYIGVFVSGISAAGFYQWWGSDSGGLALLAGGSLGLLTSTGQSHRHVMNPSTSARYSSDAEAISLLFFIPTLLVVLRRNRFITIWRTIARLLAAKPLRVRDWSSAS